MAESSTVTEVLPSGVAEETADITTADLVTPREVEAVASTVSEDIPDELTTAIASSTIEERDIPPPPLICEIANKSETADVSTENEGTTKEAEVAQLATPLILNITPLTPQQSLESIPSPPQTRSRSKSAMPAVEPMGQLTVPDNDRSTLRRSPRFRSATPAVGISSRCSSLKP